ncbi:hypothetical protein LTR17_002188 [Elasticomyces elasticus]|nr:hypothetical protein LTR17_002188 [Elasticomyces elasticus]
MLIPRPEEKRSLMARFKEFMDPQERVPNVLRKRRPDKPGVKRSKSVDEGGGRVNRLSRLRESFSGSHAPADDAVESPPRPATAALEGEQICESSNSRRKQKRSSWWHHPLGPSKSSRDRETGEGDQRSSQTPLEGGLSPTQAHSTDRTTLSRTLSAPTQPTRLSIRNAFPPRRPKLSPSPSSDSTLSDRDLDKWARNGDRVRNSHFIPPCNNDRIRKSPFIPPFRDPYAGSEQCDPVVPTPWRASEQTIPTVPGPLQARRQPSRGNLRNSRRDGRPVSQPTLLTSGNPADLRNDTDPFPSFQQPSDLQFDASRGQNNTWVEGPAPEQTYLSDAQYYASTFPVSGTSRPLSPSREASIAAGEAIAQEGEKYVAYRPPPPMPVLGPQIATQHEHEHESANQRLAASTVAELDAGPINTIPTSKTHGVVDFAEQLRSNRRLSKARPATYPFPGAAAGPTTPTPVPPIENPTQHKHDHTPTTQPPADLSVAELDADHSNTVTSSRTYGVVEFAEELRGDRRRGSSEYSEDSIDGEKGAAAVAGGAVGPASWQRRAARLEGHDMHDIPEELFEWAGRQPSVLHQLTYQRLIGSHSPFAGEEKAGGHREGAPEGPGQRYEEGTTGMDSPVAVDSSETTLRAENLVEGTGNNGLPVERERERPSSPVPVLYFTTVPPRNALA